VNQPKTFSVIVKHDAALDVSLPIYVMSGDADIKVRNSPLYFKKLTDDGMIGTTTFVVEGSSVGTEAFIEAQYAGYSNLVLVKVIDPAPPPALPEGLSFDKPLYHLKVNREKELLLWLKSSVVSYDRILAQITSNHPEIVVKGGGKLNMRRTAELGVLIGKCRIIGRELKSKGIIIASVAGFGSASTRVSVEEREPSGGVKFEFDPVEEDFGWVRYKWDDKNPYLLKIGAKHPAIRRYLGHPTEKGYPGIDSKLYHAVLAEVIAEALAFYLLRVQFKREGQGGMLDYAATDAYFHRYFSEFLNVAHSYLVEQVPQYAA
jgi:hypothetical protein